MKAWIFGLVVTGILLCSTEGGGGTIFGRPSDNKEDGTPIFGDPNSPGSGPGSSSGQAKNCDSLECMGLQTGILKNVDKNAVDCALNPEEEDCCRGDQGADCPVKYSTSRETRGRLNNEKNSRRKRSVSFGQYVLNLHLNSRVKRSDPVPPNYWWRCDNANRACCRTCRRTLPFIESFTTEDGDEVFPVFCPKAGGFQLIEQVECRKQYCHTECLWDWTFYSVLVTPTKPHAVTGHCDLDYVPTYFTRIKVWSHCTCPEIFPYKPRPPTPGPTPRPTPKPTTPKPTKKTKKPRRKGRRKKKKGRKGRKRYPA